MYLQRYEDSRRLIEEGASLLAAQPAGNSKIIRLLARLDEGTLKERAESYLALVRDDGKCCVALAAGSGDADLLLAGEDASAMALIARAALRWRCDLPGVVGPWSAVQAFAGEWRIVTGRAHRVHLRLREYALTRIIDTPALVGDIRPAREDECKLVLAWQTAFMREVGMDETDAQGVLTRLPQRLERGEIWVFADAACGAPFAMAGWADVPPRAVRIAPVYTLPQARGRGVAKALMLRLCAHLLAQDRQAIYLAADTENPISNRLYQSMGFRAEADHFHLKFVDAGSA